MLATITIMHQILIYIKVTVKTVLNIELLGKSSLQCLLMYSTHHHCWDIPSLYTQMRLEDCFSTRATQKFLLPCPIPHMLSSFHSWPTSVGLMAHSFSMPMIAFSQHHFLESRQRTPSLTQASRTTLISIFSDISWNIQLTIPVPEFSIFQCSLTSLCYVRLPPYTVPAGLLPHL